MKHFIQLFLIALLIINNLSAQNTLKNDTNPIHKVFGNIFTGGYYNFNTQKPNAGFELSTGLLGYRYQKQDKFKFTLIYDVTRTTSNIMVSDTLGNPLTVHYFAGSEYTAFLKMAEIKWYFAKHMSLAAGQLLNEQYLTVQDKYWGHRYVLTTMQEFFRLGSPADFGMRIEYDNKKTGAFSFGAVNGNGPFARQDTLSVIEYTSNLELYLIKYLLIKAFIGLTPATYVADKKLESTFSGFVAYERPKYKIGFEYADVQNIHFTDVIYRGFSGFLLYNITDKYELFTRFDYLDNAPSTNHESIFIGGFQYQPIKNLFLSLNYRHWHKSAIRQLYFNVGVKF